MRITKNVNILALAARILVVLCATSSLSAATSSSRYFRVEARVSTTMQSRNYSAKFRPELAITGGRQRFFLSQRSPKTSDDFTVSFSSSIKLRAISVATGTDTGEDQLKQGVLEVSQDGVHFDKEVAFSGGVASAKFDRLSVVAVRIRPTADSDERLAIREFDIRGDVRFGRVLRVPKVVVDTSNAPDLADWGIEAQIVTEGTYGLISDALAEKGFIGPNCVHLNLNPDFHGVATTANDVIQISPGYVRGHKADFGIIVHELTHAIQHYSKRSSPNWLAEGIADYVRLYLYEPYAPRPKILLGKSKYSENSLTTAAMLAYIQERFGHSIVGQINQSLRDGTYTDGSFKATTGKDISEIWSDFLNDLRQGRTKVAHL